MNGVDKLFERVSRHMAKRSSRRSAIKRLGMLLVGGAGIPLLPVARGMGAGDSGESTIPPKYSGVDGDPGNTNSCDYWRYCGMDGFLCSCCGGTATSCPPGTEMAPLTWIGTCQNPADGVQYIISYNDCCGKTMCGRCFCNRNEDDRPVYRAFSNNDTNWCLGTKSTIYHCTTGTIVGVATEKR